MSLLRSGSLLALVVVAALAVSGAAPRSDSARPRISVTFSADKSGSPLDGRLLLLFSKDAADEPRFQISDISLASQQVFGMDVDGWKAGQEAMFPADVLGYPVEGLDGIPAGTYRVQALLNRYETFRLGDGRVVKLLMANAVDVNGKLVAERLTQAEIGQRVGATREMAGRILRDLARGRYIECERGRITILRKLPQRW